jgi:hypothetical protein
MLTNLGQGIALVSACAMVKFGGEEDRNAFFAGIEDNRKRNADVRFPDLHDMPFMGIHHMFHDELPGIEFFWLSALFLMLRLAFRI